MIAKCQNSRKAFAVAGGCGLAFGCYSLSSMLPSNFGQGILPVLGAIAVAGIFPTFVLSRTTSDTAKLACLSMSQRLDALDKHASINIVDEADHLIEVNEQLLNLTGYTRNELIGQSVRTLYDVTSQEIAADIRAHLKRKQTWQGETPLRCKDGSTLYMQSTIMPLFDESGNWAGSISARTDVTGSKKLVEERHTAQTLYELSDDIWIIDSETETFNYMNRAAKSRFELQEEEHRSKNMADFNEIEGMEQVLEACRATQSTGEVSTKFETVFMGAPTHVTIKFLRDVDGDGRYLILLRDVSDRVAQEKAKSAFISTVSHELRSPLTSIKGAMGLLLSNSSGELTNKSTKLLDIAHRNADRLILIINDLLDLDKISNGQLDLDIEEVDLVDLIKEADLANAMLQQRFGVRVDLLGMDNSIPIRTDANRFIQVLTNLLSNAYKFSTPNSQIVIEALDKEDHVRVSVKDQGPGIPLSEQHKIFDRFADMSTSERASKGGSGLGLSICKAIVESMGGTIGFDSTEGCGSVFFFTLPKTLPDYAVPDKILEHNVAQMKELA